MQEVLSFDFAQCYWSKSRFGVTNMGFIHIKKWFCDGDDDDDDVDDDDGNDDFDDEVTEWS